LLGISSRADLRRHGLRLKNLSIGSCLTCWSGGDVSRLDDVNLYCPSRLPGQYRFHLYGAQEVDGILYTAQITINCYIVPAMSLLSSTATSPPPGNRTP